MVVSAAKLEANRRNARKSTGPRTQEGKDRSKMNATTHGCRAETLVLPEEDPVELEARRAAWTASLGPCNELEKHAVDQAVNYSRTLSTPANRGSSPTNSRPSGSWAGSRLMCSTIKTSPSSTWRRIG